MAFDFPSGPTVGQEYESGGVIYVWSTDLCWRVKAVLSMPTLATYGDMKYGFQPDDHAGWIKLDGRDISTLTATQQTQAMSLGFTTTLPDATDAFVVQSATVLGTIGGSSKKKISLAMLPVHNLSLTSVTAASGGAHTHTAQSAGAHTHTVSGNTTGNGAHGHESEAHTGGTTAGFEHPNMAWNKWHTGAQIMNDGAAYTANRKLVKDAGDHSHSLSGATAASGGAHTHPTDSQGNHTHTLTGTLPLGGTGADLDVTPKFFSANAFCYLGA